MGAAGEGAGGEHVHLVGDGAGGQIDGGGRYLHPVHVDIGFAGGGALGGDPVELLAVEGDGHGRARRAGAQVGAAYRRGGGVRRPCPLLDERGVRGRGVDAAERRWHDVGEVIG